jgi:hypothetical protein
VEGEYDDFQEAGKGGEPSLPFIIAPNAHKDEVSSNQKQRTRK